VEQVERLRRQRGWHCYRAAGSGDDPGALEADAVFDPTRPPPPMIVTFMRKDAGKQIRSPARRTSDHRAQRDSVFDHKEPAV